MLETYTALKGSDFQLPSFLDVVREVTGDSTYSMYNLSMTAGSQSENCVNDERSTDTKPDATNEVVRENIDAIVTEVQYNGKPTKLPTVPPLDTSCPEINPRYSSKTSNCCCNRSADGRREKRESPRKPHVRGGGGKVLTTSEKNAENVMRGRPLVKTCVHTKSALISAQPFDKLSKWSDAKRSFGSATFPHGLL